MYTFYDCPGLTGTLTIPEGVTSIGYSAFGKCSGFTGSLTIPNSVKTILNGAFSGCSGFNGTLTLPEGITAINNNTFDNCSGLTGTLTIPSSVTSIGNAAFSRCTGFTGSLTIPANVKIIDSNAFRLCSGFNGTLTISEGVERIGNHSFEDCTGFTGSLTIPSTVKTIDNNAFNRCNGFNGTLTISEGVTSIANDVFNFCTGFTGSLTIPGSVKTIGTRAFQGCSGLNGTLTLSEGVESLGWSAFDRCTGFTGPLTIPSTMKTIDNKAFFQCSGFNGALTIPEGVTRIGSDAFSRCSSLTGPLTIPTTITKIEAATFAYCSGLTGQLTIPSNITSIGYSAFINCSGFTEPLTIPASVTNLGGKAFQGCSGLFSATFEANSNITLGDTDLFKDCSELRYIDASNLPASVFSNFNVESKIGKKVYTLLYLPAGATLSKDAVNVVIGDVCKDLTLYENAGIGARGYGERGYEYATAIIKNFTATLATYRGKTLDDNGVYTTYLPYQITLPKEIEAYSLLSYGDKVAIFKIHRAPLNAYTPYLLRRVGPYKQMLDFTKMPDAAVTTAPEYLTNTTGGAVTDNTTNTGVWKFFGTTNPISPEEAENNRLYVLQADNTWYPVKASVAGGYVRSLRAFLQAPLGYSGAPLAFMIDEDETTTGLEKIEAEVKKENVDIYTIDGRFVGRNYESLPTGLYIISGKKVYKF